MGRQEKEGKKKKGFFSQFMVPREENIEHLVFRQKIPDFFDDRLTEDQLEKFLHHYDVCKECREEVSIQFLIHVALSRIEAGEAINLPNEMNTFVAAQRKKLVRRERFAHLTYLIETFTLVAIVFALICFVQYL